jgi:hypothetical protein
MTDSTNQSMKTIADLLDENDEFKPNRPQEDLLMACLIALMKQFPDYTPPRLRADGDIIIPLEPDLKKNRERTKNVAIAISEMMNRDNRPKRSRTWVE